MAVVVEVDIALVDTDTDQAGDKVLDDIHSDDGVLECIPLPPYNEHCSCSHKFRCIH